jgi:hypothetical protein
MFLVEIDRQATLLLEEEEPLVRVAIVEEVYYPLSTPGHPEEFCTYSLQKLLRPCNKVHE